MPPVTRSNSVSHLSATESNPAPRLQRTQSAPLLANSRASTRSAAPAAPVAQATVSVVATAPTPGVPSQQAPEVQGSNSPLAMNPVAHAMTRVGNLATVAKLRGLDKAHRGAFRDSVTQWMASASFDAAQKESPSVFKRWMAARIKDVFPQITSPEFWEEQPKQRHAYAQVSHLANELDRLHLSSNSGHALVPTPDAVHDGWASTFVPFALRVLPDVALPAYLSAADAAYGPQGDVPPEQRARYVSQRAARLLPIAAASCKPLAVEILLRRTSSASAAFNAANQLLTAEAMNPRHAGDRVEQKLHVVQQLMTRDPLIVGRSSYGVTFPNLVLSQEVSDAQKEAKFAVRSKQLELVKLIKAQFALSPDLQKVSDTNFSTLKELFTQAAQPNQEENPFVRELDKAILKELD